MNIEKVILNKVDWVVNEYCCETMEHAIHDLFILIEKGQIKIATNFRYKEGAENVHYCPFCGEKIEYTGTDRE